MTKCRERKVQPGINTTKLRKHLHDELWQGLNHRRMPLEYVKLQSLAKQQKGNESHGKWNEDEPEVKMEVH